MLIKSVLKALTVSASTSSFGNVLQILTTRAQNEYLWPPYAVVSIYLLISVSAVGDWMPYIYFHTWCRLSVNLEYRSETCCARLAENTAHKKSPKSRHSWHHPTTLSGYIFAIKAHIHNRKKLVKQPYLPHMSP